MIITTVLQMLMERLDAGKTLPQAIAEPRASQRNTTATAGRAGVQDRVRGRAGRARATRSAPSG